MPQPAYDALIAGGTLVTEAGTLRGDLAVRGGRIAALADPGRITPRDAAEVIDATGHHVLPGGVDPHFHACDLDIAYREDFESGTKAAAAGGITTVVEMPLSVPPILTLGLFERKLAELRRKAVVDCALWGGLGPDNGGEIGPMFRAGARAFKAFMCRALEYPMLDDGHLLDAMRAVARLGGLVGTHAESEGLSASLAARLKAEGRTDPRAHAEARPPVVEYEAIRRALLLARETGVHLHIVHMSLPEGARAIAEARRAGQSVTVETCPHFLALTTDDLAHLGVYAKCAPPLRDAGTVEGLWRHVLRGEVDMLASDHVSWSAEEKARGASGSIFDAPDGIQGVQAMLPLLFTEGVLKRGMTLPHLVRFTATNAARRFGLFPRKGTLRPDADADLIVVDLAAEWTFRKEQMFSKHQYSPYDGRRFRGRIRHTLVRGREVYRDGRILATPGSGHFIPTAGPHAPANGDPRRAET